MSEHPNAVWARGVWDAMRRGDMATVAAALSDDIVWHEIGRPEPRRGKAELEAAFVEADYQITPTIIDMTASDDHAIGIVDSVATRQGRTLHYRVAEIVRIQDGKVVERWAYSDDTARIAAFFA